MRSHGLNLKSARGIALGFLLGCVTTYAAVRLPQVSFTQSAVIIANQVRPTPKHPDIAFAFDRAGRLALTYKEVLAAPARHLGDPVLWDIQLPPSGTGLAYVNEDLESPVRWTVSEIHPNCPAAGGKDHRTYTLLATVKAVKGRLIELQYLDCQ